MKMKRKSKTLWWNALTVIVAILALPEVLAVIPLDAMPYILAINGIVNVALRLVTVEPLRV